MTNYASMAKRIRSCVSSADFKRAEQSLNRLYRAGVFTVAEFMRLDALMIDCIDAS